MKSSPLPTSQIQSQIQIETQVQNIIYSSLKRRMLVFCYEFVLLFGLWMFFALIYGIITQQTNAMTHRFGLQATLYIITGLYFVKSWTRHGQTLAGKTWNVSLLDSSQKIINTKTAVIRYVLASIAWFFPALFSLWVLNIHDVLIYPIIALSVILYFILAKFLPNRQFLHDVYLGTSYQNTKI